MKPLILKGEDVDFDSIYRGGRMPLIAVNMTGGCNRRCGYCHTGAGRPDENEMGPNELVNIVFRAKEMGAKTLVLGGKGEPLMDMGLAPITKAASLSGMTNIVYTNGELLESMAGYLFDNDVSVVISNHSNMTGMDIPGVRECMEAGYPDAKDMGDYTQTRLSVSSLLCKPAFDAIRPNLEFCKMHGILPMFNGIVATGRVLENRNMEELMLSESEETALYEAFRESFGEPEHGRCPIVMGMFVDNQGNVRSDGFGRSCDTYHGTIIGNVRRDRLVDCWDKLLEMRKGRGLYFDVPKGEPNRIPVCYRVRQSQAEYRKMGL